MSAEENKALVRRLLDEILNQGSIRAIDEGIAENIVRHRPPGDRELRGRDGYREDVKAVHVNFGDREFVIEDMLADDDKVAVRWVFRSVHQAGTFMGVSATGKQITTRGIIIFRIEDGKIVEDWELVDILDLMQQLGVMPLDGT